jgi:hypothetical protein
MALAALPPVQAHTQPTVAEPFRAYYATHDGMRVLGPPLTDLVMVHGIAAQYFEKGRMEDHRAEVSDPAWAIMYGRLTAELMEHAPGVAVSETDITYADLAQSNRPEARRAAPAGFTGGTLTVSEGTWPVMFVPYDSQLRPAPGYTVPMYFWDYMQRRDLFPGGWLDWVLPSESPTGRAVLELRDAAGELLAWREVQVVGPGEANVHAVRLFWLLGEMVRPHPQQIVAGERVEAAALEALLWMGDLSLAPYCGLDELIEAKYHALMQQHLFPVAMCSPRTGFSCGKLSTSPPRGAPTL